MGWIQEAKEAQARAALAGGNHSLFNRNSVTELFVLKISWYIRSLLVTLNFLDEDYTNQEDADPTSANQKSDKASKKLQEELMDTEVSVC